MFGSNPFFEEKVNSWELGVKSTLLDGRVRANASVYGYVWEDIQTAKIETDNGTATSGLVNAGEADRWGGELELMGAVSDSMVVGFNYSYINGDFEEFPDLCGVDPAVPCLDGTANAVRSNSPSNQYSAFTDITLARLGNGEISAFINVAYSEATPENALWSNLVANDVFPRENPSQIMDQKTLVDAQIAWRDITIGDGILTVAVWGKNLLDDDYPNYSINFGALNFITEQYGNPATYGVDFTYEF